MSKPCSTTCAVFVLPTFMILIGTTHVGAGPKGTVQVPRLSAPLTIDGDFSDWPLATYTTVARQPVFPAAQGAGQPTDANGDHLVWEIDRIGPFNDTDLSLYEPDNAWEFGSSIYMAYDDKFLYFLGIFIDDEPNGVRADDTFNNFLSDGFEVLIDAKGDSDDLVSEFAHPAFDEEEPNLDDFQLTIGLNDFFEPSPAGPDDLGAELHIERGGDFEIVRDYYYDIRDGTDLSSVGGRDVAAKSYDDLRAAGALNPELAADPDVTFPGYAIELVLPFGITEGFTPDHNMGFDLFWRDVDDEIEPQPGFGGGAIFWTDWAQSEVVSGVDDDGNLFHAGNWGQIEFVSTAMVPGDFDADGNLTTADIDDLTTQSAMLMNPATHDLTNDGLVNADDVTFWIDDLFGSWIGDANLDGQFNSNDLVQMLASGTYEADTSSVWSQGDFNGDGRTNSNDLVAGLAAGGYEQGPRASQPVPEPGAVVLTVVGLLGLAVIRVRRR